MASFGKGLMIPLRKMWPIVEWEPNEVELEHGPHEPPRIQYTFEAGIFVASMWHHTKLSYLIDRCPHVPGSSGILNDRGMRYGSSPHKGIRGVNFFTVDPGTLEAGKDECYLFLEITGGRRLKGGSACRACVEGEPGRVCGKVRVTALLVPILDVPPVVFGS